MFQDNTSPSSWPFGPCGPCGPFPQPAAQQPQAQQPQAQQPQAQHQSSSPPLNFCPNPFAQCCGFRQSKPEPVPPPSTKQSTALPCNIPVFGPPPRQYGGTVPPPSVDGNPETPQQQIYPPPCFDIPLH